MDAIHFDRLARSLMTRPSRRTMLRGLASLALGGAVASAGTDEATADHGCRHAGDRCKRPGQCCSGKCSKARKKCLCTAASCTATDPCQEAFCSSKFKCTVRDKTCDDGIACTVDTCDATGTCLHTADHSACSVTGQTCDPERGGCVCPVFQVECGGSCVTEGVSCATGHLGVCSTGTLQCDGDALVCVADIEPGSQEEICGNNLDDDCDGAIDEGCPAP